MRSGKKRLRNTVKVLVSAALITTVLMGAAGCGANVKMEESDVPMSGYGSYEAVFFEGEEFSFKLDVPGDYIDKLEWKEDKDWKKDRDLDADSRTVSFTLETAKGIKEDVFEIFVIREDITAEVLDELNPMISPVSSKEGGYTYAAGFAEDPSDETYGDDSALSFYYDFQNDVSGEIVRSLMPIQPQ